MSGPAEHGNEADRRLAEAAAWRMRLTEADAPSTLEFEMWLRGPGNRTAWDQVSRAWGLFDQFAPEPALASARQAALADSRRAGHRLTARRVIRSLSRLAAALLLVSVAGGGVYWWQSRPDDYQTAMGERRVVTLSDGSKLSLDSGSEVTVKYERHGRFLHLLRGQARFDVAHDKSRPFSVVAGDQKVIATGTAFNIDMAGPKVLVTLIEGHVVILEANGGGDAANWSRSIELHAGQQLSATEARRPQITPANIQRVTAWTVGQIIFDDEPLWSVVDRVNRYSDTHVVISDPSVGAMKISGVFNAGDAAGFVEIVTHYLPVKAVPEGSIIALQNRTKERGAL